MASPSVTYTFTTSTTADGTQVNQNFTDLVNFIQTYCIQKDGSTAMTAALTLSGNPSADNDAVRKKYMDGPYVEATGGVSQSWTSGTYATVLFTTETTDTDAAWDNATGIFTAPRTGVYLVTVGCLFTNTAVTQTLKLLTTARSFILFDVDDTTGFTGQIELNKAIACRLTSGQTLRVQYKIGTTTTKTVSDWITIAWLHG